MESFQTRPSRSRRPSQVAMTTLPKLSVFGVVSLSALSALQALASPVQAVESVSASNVQPAGSIHPFCTSDLGEHGVNVVGATAVSLMTKEGNNAASVQWTTSYFGGRVCGYAMADMCVIDEENYRLNRTRGAYDLSYEPRPTAHHCCAVDQDSAIMACFGGTSASSKIYRFSLTDSVWLKPITATLKEELDFGLLRRGHACSVVDHTLYVWGGVDPSGRDAKEVLIFIDLEKQRTWKSLNAQQPVDRHGHSLVRDGDDLIALFGQPGYIGVQSAMLRFNVETGSFMKLDTEPPLPDIMDGASCAPYYSKQSRSLTGIFCAGGRTKRPGSSWSDLDQYKPFENLLFVDVENRKSYDLGPLPASEKQWGLTLSIHHTKKANFVSIHGGRRLPHINDPRVSTDVYNLPSLACAKSGSPFPSVLYYRIPEKGPHTAGAWMSPAEVARLADLRSFSVAGEISSKKAGDTVMTLTYAAYVVVFGLVVAWLILYCCQRPTTRPNTTSRDEREPLMTSYGPSSLLPALATGIYGKGNAKDGNGGGSAGVYSEPRGFDDSVGSTAPGGNSGKTGGNMVSYGTLSGSTQSLASSSTSFNSSSSIIISLTRRTVDPVSGDVVNTIEYTLEIPGYALNGWWIRMMSMISTRSSTFDVVTFLMALVDTTDMSHRSLPRIFRVAGVSLQLSDIEAFDSNLVKTDGASIGQLLSFVREAVLLVGVDLVIQQVIPLFNYNAQSKAIASAMSKSSSSNLSSGSYPATAKITAEEPNYGVGATANVHSAAAGGMKTCVEEQTVTGTSGITITLTKQTLDTSTQKVLDVQEYTINIPEAALNGWWTKMILTTKSLSKTLKINLFLTALAEANEVNDVTLMDAFKQAGCEISVNELTTIKSESAAIDMSLLKLLDFVRETVILVGPELTEEQVLPLFDYNVSTSTTHTTTTTTTDTAATEMTTAKTPEQVLELVNSSKGESVKETTSIDSSAVLVVTLTKQTVNPTTNEIIETSEYNYEIPVSALDGWWSRLVTMVTTRFTTFNITVFIERIAACTVLSSESVLEAFRLAGAPMSKSECESLYSQAGISGNAVERIDIIRKACDLVGQDLVIEQVLPLFDHNATQTIATTTTETTSTTTAVPMESSSTNTKETDAINYDLTEAELASSIVVTLTKTTVNPVTNEVIESVDYDLSLPEAFLSGSWQRIIRIVTTRYTTFNTAVFLTCIGESSGSLTESSLLDAFSKAGAPLSPGELDLCKGEVSKENSYALMKLMTIVRKAVQLVGVDLVVEQVLPLLDYRVSSSTEVSNSATMVNTSPTPDSVYQTAVPKSEYGTVSSTTTTTSTTESSTLESAPGFVARNETITEAPVVYERTESSSSTVIVTLTKTTLDGESGQVIDSIDYDLEIPSFALTNWWPTLIQHLTTRYSLNVHVFLTRISECNGAVSETVIMDALAAAGAPISYAELRSCMGAEFGMLVSQITFVCKAVRLVGVELFLEQVAPLLSEATLGTQETSTHETTTTTTTVTTEAFEEKTAAPAFTTYAMPEAVSSVLQTVVLPSEYAKDMSAGASYVTLAPAVSSQTVSETYTTSVEPAAPPKITPSSYRSEVSEVVRSDHQKPSSVIQTYESTPVVTRSETTVVEYVTVPTPTTVMPQSPSVASCTPPVTTSETVTTVAESSLQPQTKPVQTSSTIIRKQSSPVGAKSETASYNISTVPASVIREEKVVSYSPVVVSSSTTSYSGMSSPASSTPIVSSLTTSYSSTPILKRTETVQNYSTSSTPLLSKTEVVSTKVEPWQTDKTLVEEVVVCEPSVGPVELKKEGYDAPTAPSTSNYMAYSAMPSFSAAVVESNKTYSTPTAPVASSSQVTAYETVTTQSSTGRVQSVVQGKVTAGEAVSKVTQTVTTTTTSGIQQGYAPEQASSGYTSFVETKESANVESGSRPTISYASTTARPVSSYSTTSSSTSSSRPVSSYSSSSVYSSPMYTPSEPVVDKSSAEVKTYTPAENGGVSSIVKRYETTTTTTNPERTSVYVSAPATPSVTAPPTPHTTSTVVTKTETTGYSNSNSHENPAEQSTAKSEQIIHIPLKETPPAGYSSESQTNVQYSSSAPNTASTTVATMAEATGYTANKPQPSSASYTVYQDVGEVPTAKSEQIIETPPSGYASFDSQTTMQYSSAAPTTNSTTSTVTKTETTTYKADSQQSTPSSYTLYGSPAAQSTTKSEQIIQIPLEEAQTAGYASESQSTVQYSSTVPTSTTSTVVKKTETTVLAANKPQPSSTSSYTVYEGPAKVSTAKSEQIIQIPLNKTASESQSTVQYSSTAPSTTSTTVTKTGTAEFSTSGPQSSSTSSYIVYQSPAAQSTTKSEQIIQVPLKETQPAGYTQTTVQYSSSSQKVPSETSTVTSVTDAVVGSSNVYGSAQQMTSTNMHPAATSSTTTAVNSDASTNAANSASSPSDTYESGPIVVALRETPPEHLTDHYAPAPWTQRVETVETWQIPESESSKTTSVTTTTTAITTTTSSSSTVEPTTATHGTVVAESSTLSVAPSDTVTSSGPIMITLKETPAEHLMGCYAPAATPSTAWTTAATEQTITRTESEFSSAETPAASYSSDTATSSGPIMIPLRESPPEHLTEVYAPAAYTETVKTEETVIHTSDAPSGYQGTSVHEYAPTESMRTEQRVMESYETIETIIMTVTKNTVNVETNEIIESKEYDIEIPGFAQRGWWSLLTISIVRKFSSFNMTAFLAALSRREQVTVETIVEDIKSCGAHLTTSDWIAILADMKCTEADFVKLMIFVGTAVKLIGVELFQEQVVPLLVSFEANSSSVTTATVTTSPVPATSSEVYVVEQKSSTGAPSPSATAYSTYAPASSSSTPVVTAESKNEAPYSQDATYGYSAKSEASSGPEVNTTSSTTTTTTTTTSSVTDIGEPIPGAVETVTKVDQVAGCISVPTDNGSVALDVPEYACGDWWTRLVVTIRRKYSSFNEEAFVARIGQCENVTESVVLAALNDCGAAVSRQEYAQIESDCGCTVETNLVKRLTFIRTAVRVVGVQRVLKTVVTALSTVQSSAQVVPFQQETRFEKIETTTIIITLTKNQVNPDTNEVLSTTEFTLEIPGYAQSGWWSRFIAVVTRRQPTFDVAEFLQRISSCEVVSTEMIVTILASCGARISAEELSVVRAEAGCESDATLSQLLTFFGAAVRLVGSDVVLEQVVPFLASLDETEGAFTVIDKNESPSSLVAVPAVAAPSAAASGKYSTGKRESWFSRVAKVVKEGAAAAGTTVRLASESAGSAIVQGASAVADGAVAVGNAVKTGAQATGTAVSSGVKVAGSTITETAAAAGNVITQGVDAAGGAALAGATVVGVTVFKVGEAAGSAAKTVSSAASNGFQVATESTSSAVAQGVAAIETTASAAGGAVKYGALGVASAVASGAKNAGASITQGASIAGGLMAQGASVTGSAIAQGARATGNAALYGVDAVGAAALKTAELSEAAKTTIASSVYQGGASALAAGTSIKSGLAGLADSVVTGAKVAAGSVSQGATKAGTLIAQGAAAAGNAALSGVDAIGAAALKTSEATESAKSKITTTVYKGGEDLLTNTSSAFQAASSAVLDTAVTAGSSIKYAAGAASSTVYAGAESAGAVTAEGATVTKQAASNVGATLFGAGKSAVSAVTSLLGRRPESGGSPTPAAGGVVTTATSSSQPSYSTVSGSEGTLEYATVTVRKQVLDRKTNEVVDTVEIPLEVPAIAMEGWWGRMVAWVTARYPAFDAEKFLTSVSETQEVTDETFAVSLKIAGAFVTEDEVKQLAEVVIGEGDATRCKKILVVVRKIVRIVGAKATIEQVAPVFQHVTTRTTRITIKIRRILTAEQVEAGCQETEETIDIPPLALAWWQKWMVSVIRRSKSFSMTVFLAVLGDYEDVNDRTVMEAFTAAGASVSHSELQEMRRDPSSGAGVLTTTWTALKFVRRVVRICGVDAVKQQIVPLLWTSDDHHDTLTASSSHDDLSTVESSYAVTPSTSYMPSPERKPFDGQITSFPAPYTADESPYEAPSKSQKRKSFLTKVFESGQNVLTSAFPIARKTSLSDESARASPVPADVPATVYEEPEKVVMSPPGGSSGTVSQESKEGWFTRASRVVRDGAAAASASAAQVGEVVAAPIRQGAGAAGTAISAGATLALSSAVKGAERVGEAAETIGTTVMSTVSSNGSSEMASSNLYGTDSAGQSSSIVAAETMEQQTTTVTEKSDQTTQRHQTFTVETEEIQSFVVTLTQETYDGDTNAVLSSKQLSLEIPAMALGTWWSTMVSSVKASHSAFDSKVFVAALAQCATLNDTLVLQALFDADAPLTLAEWSSVKLAVGGGDEGKVIQWLSFVQSAVRIVGGDLFVDQVAQLLESVHI